MATIDYMVASYGPYSASATGGNALARDFLAGIAAMYSVPSKIQQPQRQCRGSLKTGPEAYLNQCTKTSASRTRSNGPRHFWASCLFCSSSRSISFTGLGRVSARNPSLLRSLLVTGRGLNVGFLNVALVSLGLKNGISREVDVYLIRFYYLV